ncbi:MAG: hypothetical protein MJE68_21590, partial [Proteobacteria bacterium]|nr:hypothetical protein [Pseudomonadota bacterium]
MTQLKIQWTILREATRKEEEKKEEATERTRSSGSVAHTNAGSSFRRLPKFNGWLDYSTRYR